MAGSGKGEPGKSKPHAVRTPPKAVAGEPAGGRRRLQEDQTAQSPAAPTSTNAPEATPPTRRITRSMSASSAEGSGSDASAPVRKKPRTSYLRKPTRPSIRLEEPEAHKLLALADEAKLKKKSAKGPSSAKKQPTGAAPAVKTPNAGLCIASSTTASVNSNRGVESPPSTTWLRSGSVGSSGGATGELPCQDCRGPAHRTVHLCLTCARRRSQCRSCGARR